MELSKEMERPTSAMAQQIPVSTPHQGKAKQETSKEDRIKRYVSHIREEIGMPLPQTPSAPPPVPLDFPMESRNSQQEYRRVDEYYEDPRLRAELYPLEEELSRNQVQGSFKQATDTIEILPERNVQSQGTSELNLIPTQKVVGRDLKAGHTKHFPFTLEKNEIKIAIGESPDHRVRPNSKDSFWRMEEVYEGANITANTKPERSLLTERGSRRNAAERSMVWSQGRSFTGKNFENKSYSGADDRIQRGAVDRSTLSADPREQTEIAPMRRNAMEEQMQNEDGRQYDRKNVVDVPRREEYISRSFQVDDNRQQTTIPRRSAPENFTQQNSTSRSYQSDDLRRKNTIQKRSIQESDSSSLTVIRRSFPTDDSGQYTITQSRINAKENDFQFRDLDMQDARQFSDFTSPQEIRRSFQDDPRRSETIRKSIPVDNLRKESGFQELYISPPDSTQRRSLQNEPRHSEQGSFQQAERGTFERLLPDQYDFNQTFREDIRTLPYDEYQPQKSEFNGSLQMVTSQIQALASDSHNWRSTERGMRTSVGDRTFIGSASGQVSDAFGGNEKVPRRTSIDERRVLIQSSLKKSSGFEERPEQSVSSKITSQSLKSGVSKSDSLRRRSGDASKYSIPSKFSQPYEALKEEPENLSVEKRDSVLLPLLEEGEKEFHDLVAAGDVSAVRLFLRDRPEFNINCVDYQKISALHVAVHEQNEAMVEFLLEQPSLDCSDCILYAIKWGNVRIVEKIMDKVRETSPEQEFSAITNSVDFTDDITPIILAAQLGNYEMIDFLIKRDHRIPPVHNPYCKCDACRADLQQYDRLKYSTMKLNLYKAICNPMYIFHVTDDPFQRAFELTQELQDAAKVFPQFKTSYEELWKSLREFTVDLIGCCRNAPEVEIILKKSATNLAGHVTFPRLQYAIDLKQKEFVSHPYTQAVLIDAWTGDLLEWKVRSPLMQSLSVFPRILMLPVMPIMCMFLPGHKLVKKWKTPVNKMISSVASYLIFLTILFFESNLDKKHQKRGPPNSGLETIIIIYVIGYIWLNIRLCFRLGPRRFFSTMWHWFDCIMLFLFTMTVIFWIASLADVTANNEIDLPRKYWNSFDPELVAEGFFAAAVIMAFFRLNMFLSLNYHLGPLQVSIGKMTLDIFRFLIIFFIIILAWCAGLCRFYQPYDGMVQKDAASGSSTTQVSSFVSFSMTLKTFFWAIFGMSPIESADVVIENLPGDTPDTTIINHHEFTEAVGYTAFALFQFLSVVVVLNMLVACMANTFTKVIDNVTVEWVFGRSQIYLNFMAASTLPPPLNLIPTASGIRKTYMWFKLLAKPRDGQRAKCSLSHCCFIESETEEYVNSEFPLLMSELAQRYLHLKDESTVKECDLEELKSEMRELQRKMDRIDTIKKFS